MEEAESGGFGVGPSITGPKVAKVGKKLCDSRHPKGDKSARSSSRL